MKQENELQTLLNTLNRITFTDVVAYYLEAKTGNEQAFDALSVETLELIDSLNENIKDAIVNSIIRPQ